jgi:hypothetical protein
LEHNRLNDCTMAYGYALALHIEYEHLELAPVVVVQ